MNILSGLTIFDNEEFGQVRIVELDGKPYFMANDIAKALGYSDCPKAIRTHCKGVAEIATPTTGGVQNVKFISEGDVYRLIIKSRLPSAERFEKWVFDEVLPSIRKHGMYAKDELLNNPDLIISIAQELKTEREKNRMLQQKAEQDKPLVDFAVHVSQTKDTIGMEEMAKIARDERIEIGRNRLIKWLKDKKILQNNCIPYQTYIERGYFNVVEVKKDTVYGVKIFPKTVITGKGQIWLMGKLKLEYQS